MSEMFLYIPNQSNYQVIANAKTTRRNEVGFKLRGSFFVLNNLLLECLKCLFSTKDIYFYKIQIDEFSITDLYQIKRLAKFKCQTFKLTLP